MRFGWDDAIVGIGLILVGAALYLGLGEPWLLGYLGVLLIVIGMGINSRLT